MKSQYRYQGWIVNAFEGWTQILEVRIIDLYIQLRRSHYIWFSRSQSDGEGWSDVAMISPANARSFAQHLLNAADLADEADDESQATITGVRQLPTILLCGNRFVIDERLRQIRNVENPFHAFDLDDRTH